MTSLETGYMLLLAAIVFCVVQATLDHAGVGHIGKPQGRMALIAFGAFAFPLALLANFGVIAVSIWSLFSFKLLPAATILATGFIAWGFAWAAILTRLRESSLWPAIIASGFPLMVTLKGITAACVIGLAWLLANGLRG